uniref:Epsilon-sarcoglycan n=1 Tax=Lygus hesperus TaxID=30085 RepID=A0A0A9XBN9_LYGHE
MSRGAGRLQHHRTRIDVILRPQKNIIAMGIIVVLFTLSATLWTISSAEDLQKTKVFVIPVEPTLFNWTNGFTPNGYWYRASLINSPDLPQWMSYLFSKRHRKGFIYGVPPNDATNVQVEVVGLNREDYETRKAIIPLNITEKSDLAKYEIRLKIDNLNIEDLFDPHRLFNLLRIFTTILWPESADNLYMTFLVSAVKLGARLPLSPNDGEGVVVHLGSSSRFSETLEHLEQEVLPLRKITPCPRDFKRSSVDRHFRPSGFVIDWCSFRLVKLENSSDRAPYQEPSQDYAAVRIDDLVRREEIPRRDYSMEIITTLIVPIISMLALVAFLSVILCVQHDNLDKPYKEDTLAQGNDCVQVPQCTLRDGNLASDGSPRLTERDDACRPSPPPYSGTKRFQFDS